MSTFFISHEKLLNILKEKNLSMRDIHNKFDEDIGAYRIDSYCSGEVAPFLLFRDILVDFLGCELSDIRDDEASDKALHKQAKELYRACVLPKCMYEEVVK